MSLAEAHSSNSTNCNVNKQEYIFALNQKMLHITTVTALLIILALCSSHLLLTFLNIALCFPRILFLFMMLFMCQIVIV